METLHKIDGVNITTATPTEKIVDNIKKNNYSPSVIDLLEFRGAKPVALIGGGPSLKTTIGEIPKYEYTMVCGSAHDYVASQGIEPTWCAVCDPDPIVIKYMQQVNPRTKYLVASQCDPKVFKYLAENNCDVYIWHCISDQHDNNELFKDADASVTGGCTILTRAMELLIKFGFNKQHLYGMDTCLSSDYQHHAYDFQEPENETLGEITDFYIGDPENSPKFKMASYHIAQLFDFRQTMLNHPTTLDVEVFGGGVLSYLIECAFKEVQNGNRS